MIVELKTSRSKRRVALPSEGVEALRLHCETMMAEGLRASKWLFPNGHGELLQAVSARLGHANVSMTLDVYAHLMPAHAERSMAILEQLYPARGTAG